MKRTKRKVIKSFIIIIIMIIFSGSFLLLELGAPLKAYAAATESEQSVLTYSEFLHNATLRKSGSLDVAPSITVLNHGYDGHADAWYNGNPEKTGKMLAEKLRNELTADVYIMGIVKDSRVYKQHEVGYIDYKYDAGNDRYTDGNGQGIKKQEVGLANEEKGISQELNHNEKGQLIYDDALMLGKETINSVRGELADFEVEIKKLDWNGKADYSEGYYTETKVDNFLDFNKNIVILFDAVDNKGYHSAVYEEFNAVLDTVSYAYLSVNGFLPKYNLVGHSRGGVVNLMYATWHPYNVENLISIDTPYYGLRYADIFDIEVLFDLHDFLYSTPLMDTIRNGGGQDFINLRESDRLRTEWNNMLANNPK
jgi:uncharacterized alpha/beta hydrolase family protein